jgi:dolichol-phosphate mannosyltransferase
MDKESAYVSAVLYMHNTGSCICDSLKVIHSVLKTSFKNYEIIIVDDDSNDSGETLIKEMLVQEEIRSCTVLKMSYYHGMESSMNAGRDLAIGDFVYEFDSCFIDYDPSLILEVYQRSLQGYDIVSAGHRKKRTSSSLFYLLFNKFSFIQYKLSTESFRILSRRAINRIKGISTAILYRKAIYANCGLKIDRLYYVKKNPINHLYPKVAKDTTLNAFILFTNIFYRFAVLLSLIMMVITFSGMVYTIILYFYGKAVSGYISTLFVLTAGFFVVFALLAVIIKYLSLIINILFKKTDYVIESIDKITNL